MTTLALPALTLLPSLLRGDEGQKVNAPAVAP